MNHCIGCPFAADCNGHCDLDPIVSVVPKALADMTIMELRAARLVAVDAGQRTRALLISKYISAAYVAQRDYRRADRFFREYSL